MRLVLFQPQIPQNTGALLRLGACMGVHVDLIEPMGFVFSERRMKRAGMDYIDHVSYDLHPSWASFQTSVLLEYRRILLTPHQSVPYQTFEFLPTDALILGRESDGFPDHLQGDITHRVGITMHKECRSLNVALCGAIVLSEALRQCHLLK